MRSNCRGERVAASLRCVGRGLLTREIYASHSEAATVAERSQPNERGFLPELLTQARDTLLSDL